MLAIGMKPDDQLYRDLKDKIFDLHIIGDAREPRQIMEAVREGFYVSYYL